MNILSQLISNVGFPIAAFAAMYYMCMKTIEELRDSMSEFSATNAELTSSIRSLCAKFDAEE